MFQRVRAGGVSPGLLLRNAAVAFVAAAAVNIMTGLAAARLLNLSLPEFEPFTWLPIVISTGVGTALAAVAALACVRFTRRPDRHYLTLLAFGTALSLPIPLSLLPTPHEYPGTNGTAVAVLMLMHAVVGVAALVLSPRHVRAGRTQNQA